MKNITTRLILFVLFFSNLVRAETLNIGVPESSMYPLYHGLGTDYTGFSRELLDLFAKEYGHTFVYTPLPIKRLFLYFHEGGVDLKFPDDETLQPTEMKQTQVYYSAPVLTVWQEVMVLPGRQKGKTLTSVSLVRGWVLSESTLGKHVTLLEVPTLESALRLVFVGRVDGVWVNIQVGGYALKNILHKPNGLVFDDLLPTMSYRYSLSSLRYPEVVSQFSQFLVKYSEQIAKLKHKYEIYETKDYRKK